MSVGFTADEIATSEQTRSARLKWVVVMNAALPPGLATNAAICVSAATATGVDGLIGPDGKDAAGVLHAGLPWAGCTVLSATSQELTQLRERVTGADDIYVADMPAAAQNTRVYDEYLESLATTAPAEVDYYAVSVVGPRNRIAKIVKTMGLL